MASKTCSPYDISAVIAAELETYTKEVVEDIAKAANEVSTELVSTLKQSSPKKTGKYAKSWTKKKEGNRYRVYNKKYQLTHLLEYGHVKRNGGRVAAKAHIRPAEEDAVKEFVEKVERAVKG